MKTRQLGRKLEHLDENLASAKLELTTGDLREIDATFAAIDVEGAPLSEWADFDGRPMSVTARRMK